MLSRIKTIKMRIKHSVLTFKTKQHFFELKTPFVCRKCILTMQNAYNKRKNQI